MKKIDSVLIFQNITTYNTKKFENKYYINFSN